VYVPAGDTNAGSETLMETVTQETALDSRFTEFNIRKDLSHFVRLHDHATKRFESYVRTSVQH
jgi:hypothetical protein